MSRIDEAMKRARLHGPGAEAHSTSAPSDFLGSWQIDRYPAETAEGRALDLAPVTDAQNGRRPVAVVAVSRDIKVTLASRVSRLGAKLVVGHGASPVFVEQYRRLATSLCQAQAERSTQVVMVASALPGEGKTHAAANLALTLSESYKQSVLLVDADLRRPGLHEIFSVVGAQGLNDGLSMDSPINTLGVRLSPRLTLLPAGRPGGDPMAILSSPAMKKLLRDGAREFTWVIVDTPPVGQLSDGRLLSGAVDCAVLVVQAGKTPHRAVQAAIDNIGREHVIGVVLNRASPESLSYGYHYSLDETESPKAG